MFDDLARAEELQELRICELNFVSFYFIYIYIWGMESSFDLHILCLVGCNSSSQTMVNAL